MPKTVDSAHTKDQNEHPDDTKRQPAYSAPDQDNDDLDFVVTEAHDQETELVGGFKSTGDDSLGIKSNADMMQPDASPETTGKTADPSSLDLQIGDTNPPPPPPADYTKPPDPPDSLDLSSDTLQAPQPESGLEKLSDERLEEISRKMQGKSEGSDYLTAEEKHQLIHSIEDAQASESATGFDNEPIVPPKKTGDAKPSVADIKLTGKKPRMSARSRGVAYYARGFIKIQGGQELREGDDLVINGREYALRQKKFSARFMAAVITPVAALLVFAIGALLVSSADTGAGRIVGVALDAYDQPFLAGAVIHLPERGASYETNSQGFFKTDQLDAGSYEIEFIIDDEVVAIDYATVTGDEITTLTLRAGEVDPAPPPPTPEPEIAQAPPPQPAATTPPPAKPKPKATAKEKSSSKKAASTPRYAKLSLAANVDGAKLSIDGSVLGAGNLTYTKLRPGEHTYSVAKDGYQSVQGTIDLTAGKTGTLEVTLIAATPTQKAETYLERDYYHSAVAALDQGNVDGAIADLTQAITLSPSYVDAYVKRAEAYTQNSDKQSAHSDYVRAAEIYQFRKDYSQAFAAYDQAFAIDAKSIPAFLGRGNLYLAKGEEIAAIADFDMVVRLDKRDIEGYMGLGKARYNQGYFKKAIKHFKDARSIDSKKPVIHRNLMLCYFAIGDHKQIKKSYEKFVECASEAEVQRMRADSRFAPVLRITDD